MKGTRIQRGGGERISFWWWVVCVGLIVALLIFSQIQD